MLRDTESFLRLRDETAAACTAHGVTTALRHLVIDDSAGTDPEVEALTRLPGVEVLVPPFNLGHQRAIVYGLRHLLPRLSNADVVVTMDSDGEDQPADVPRLLSALNAEQVTLALAVRTKRSESVRFRVMYLFFRVMFRVFTGTTVRSGNFAAQSASSLAATIHHPSFDLCYSSSLLALRRPTASVPCARGRRFAGSSRMNTYALMAHGVRMLLPFSERIAVRAMFVASVTLVGVLTHLGILAGGGFGDHPGPAVYSVLVALGTLFVASLTTFVVLFSGFAQASAIAMKGIGVPDLPAHAPKG